MEKNKKKNILITAGPTWVPIDRVRIITTVFGGKLGWEIAKFASEKNYNVTLLMGPGRVSIPKKISKSFRIIRFKYFDELLNLVTNELKSKEYDAIIHSAAVPDYIPKKTNSGKIKSGISNFKIEFKRTIKIVDLIKKIRPDIFLVKFKLEVGKSKAQLIDIAYKSMVKSKADLIVANDYNDMKRKHKAYIIKKDKSYIIVNGKKEIASGVLKLI
ncbi:MAG: phosphopantothenoylcysteine decarboxylase [Patescibacteria group bacterium]|jgi:phosphopantothenoylcysteine synthetase/decarboxylase